MNREKVEYDNRFGFAKYCTAYWVCDHDRVGEDFIFRFPNGVKVSVIRHTVWDYNFVKMGCSFGISYGFTQGLYELAVATATTHFGEHEPIGWLTAKDVRKHLSRLRNLSPNQPF